jgi:uncharacterized protein (DUF433 family)
MNTTGIWTDKDRCSGKPCLRNTRMPMCQILAELADGRPLSEIAEDFDLDYNNMKEAWTNLVQELNKLRINSKYIMSDPDTRGGENCIQGHRIPISLLLMNLLDGDSTPNEEAEDYELEQEEVEGVLWNLAALLDREWTDGPPADIKKAISEGPE